MISKNKDYGNKNLLSTGIPGIATRLLDKVSRLQNLITKGDGANFESIDDTLQDIANYGVIGQLMRQGGLKQPVPRMIYMAGPIDDVEPDEAGDWRYRFSTLVSLDRITTYNPYQAFKGFPEASHEIIEANRRVIEMCDCLVAYLNTKGRAFGTIREIEYAIVHKKSVVVICDDLLSLAAYDCTVVPTIGDAVKLIISGELTNRSPK